MRLYSIISVIITPAAVPAAVASRAPVSVYRILVITAGLRLYVFQFHLFRRYSMLTTTSFWVTIDSTVFSLV